MIQVGEAIGGYTIQRALGAGGMGEVYAARRGDRVVAIKVLRSQGATERLRFEREAQAAARVPTHPSVLAIHSYGLSPTPYVVMPLIAGGSLRQAWDDRGLWDWSEARPFAAGIAGALAHLHAAGVVHRDLKPENVLVSEAGGPVLCDFGLARTLDSKTLTEDGVVLGTLPYMAPEQLRGERESPATDVWALGVLLCEALTGRRPFRGATPWELSSAQERGFPNLGEGGQALSSGDLALLRAMLSADPAARPSAAEVWDVLNRPPAEAPARGPSWRATLAVALLVSGAALGAWLWAATSEAERRPPRLPLELRGLAAATVAQREAEVYAKALGSPLPLSAFPDSGLEERARRALARLAELDPAEAARARPGLEKALRDGRWESALQADGEGAVDLAALEAAARAGAEASPEFEQRAARLADLRRTLSSPNPQPAASLLALNSPTLELGLRLDGWLDALCAAPPAGAEDPLPLVTEQLVGASQPLAQVEVDQWLRARLAGRLESLTADAFERAAVRLESVADLLPALDPLQSTAARPSPVWERLAWRRWEGMLARLEEIRSVFDGARVLDIVRPILEFAEGLLALRWIDELPLTFTNGHLQAWANAEVKAVPDRAGRHPELRRRAILVIALGRVPPSCLTELLEADIAPLQDREPARASVAERVASIVMLDKHSSARSMGSDTRRAACEAIIELLTGEPLQAALRVELFALLLIWSDDPQLISEALWSAALAELDGLRAAPTFRPERLPLAVARFGLARSKPAAEVARALAVFEAVNEQQWANIQQENRVRWLWMPVAEEEYRDRGSLVASLRSQLARREGDLEGALHAASEALSKAPDSTDAAAWLARLRARLEGREAALRFAREWAKAQGKGDRALARLEAELDAELEGEQ